MLDKTVPYFNVILANDGTKRCPTINLPEGFTFCGYEDGLELEWVKVAMDTNQFATFAEALKFFDTAFLNRKDLLNKQVLFVKNIAGEIIATGSIWAGHNFDRVLQRINFVCVLPEYDGKGIHGALVSKLLDVYCEMQSSNFVYITSSTWNYLEIHEYLTLGFSPYMGERPANWGGTPARFNRNKVVAWEIIMKKIHEIYPPAVEQESTQTPPTTI